MRIRSAIVALLLAATPALAQHSPRLTYVAEFNIRWDEGTEHINLTRKYDKPMLDTMLANGTVLDWGEDVAVVRRESAPTHRVWVVTADYEAMAKVVTGFNRMQTPDQDVARYIEIANLSKLHERYLSSVLLGNSTSPSSRGSIRVISTVKVKSGKGSEWLAVFEQHRKPFLDSLVASGMVHSWGVDIEDVHTQEHDWRWVWVVINSLADADVVLRKADHSMSDGVFAAVSEPGTHRDYVYRKVLSGGPALR